MKRVAGMIALTAVLLLCLSGCMFRSVDELYALPKTSETFMNLQATIDAVKGNAERIAPTSGSRTQAIQLYDLLMDGQQEAIAFFRDSSAERPLKIAIFKQIDNGEYALYALIEGAGADIESIEYADLTGDEAMELVVSWQTAAVHNLTAYSISGGLVAELMVSGYNRYLAADLDENGKSELYLTQVDSSTPGGNKVELYVGNSGVMELHSTAPLSDGTVPVIEQGVLQGGIPALFVTSEMSGDAYRVTDIICLTETGVRNITLDETNRRSNTVRIHTGLGPTDINGDGVTEIPITASFHSPSAVAGDNFWKILWKQYASNGSEQLAMSTYHNNQDRWYLVLPDAWDGKITLSRSETSVTERAVIFSYWEGDPAIPPEKFLTIYRLTGANREVHAGAEGRFRLELEDDDPDAIYVAELHACSWDPGLDQDGVRERFHSIIN